MSLISLVFAFALVYYFFVYLDYLESTSNTYMEFFLPVFDKCVVNVLIFYLFYYLLLFYKGILKI